MRESRKIMRKGAASIIALVIAASILILALYVVSVLPKVLTRRHLIQTFAFEYNYNNAQLALNTLLSLTAVDTIDSQEKPASQIIAEYVTFTGSKPSKIFLDTELNRMVEEKIFECYILTSDRVGLLSKNTQKCQVDEGGEYKAYATISTPDGTDRLKLVIGWS
jgi:hypothetical protein